VSSDPAIPANSKQCEHCHATKAQAKVTFNGVVLKLCKPCLEIEQKRVAMSRLCERCAQGKQVRANFRNQKQILFVFVFDFETRKKKKKKNCQ
jgi:hypothetical protein